MKTFSLTTAAFFLVFGALVSSGAEVTRISNETGVSVATLQSERATTGLGLGELEKAHLLANASGKSFNSIVAMHKGGAGFGKIAQDNGLTLGKIESSARRSVRASVNPHRVRVSASARNSKVRPGDTAPRPNIVAPRASVVGPRPSIVGPQPSIVGPRASIVGPRASIVGPPMSIAPAATTNGGIGAMGRDHGRK